MSGIDTVHQSCWGFWARRASISIDILELGRYLVGREERFWVVFCKSDKEASSEQTKVNSIRFGYLFKIHAFF